MRTSWNIISVPSAWFMAIVYYQIEVATGVEFTPLLGAAIITLAVGLYFGYRNNKEITREEA